MSAWQMAIAAALGGAAVAILHQIFLEIRSIRRMMNRDRNIEPD